EIGQLLAHARELDRLAGDVTYRQRRAAARIAVQLREHHSCERQRIGEGFGDVDRILPLHGIDDEERFNGIERGVQRADLLHHRVVDRETAGRIYDDDVVI